MEGRRKPLLFKLTLLCFKFMPAGNLLGGSCKAGRVSRLKLPPKGLIATASRIGPWKWLPVAN